MAKSIVSIHQPHYFPWLGLIEKIACSDHFIFLDNVQFEKNGWQNRTRYSTSDGIKFLTLPVRQKGVLSQTITISDIELADTNAPIKHWRTLSQRYAGRPGWKLIASKMEAVLCTPYKTLMPLCIATTTLTLEVYKIMPSILYSSNLRADGLKGDRVINLVSAAKGDAYLSGSGAKAYLDAAAFEKSGLGLSFQEFKHPEYAQSTGVEFQPAAFALEWFIEHPDNAVKTFHEHLRANKSQPPRCLV